MGLLGKVAARARGILCHNGYVGTRPCTFPVRIVVVDPEGRERIVLLEEGREGPICVGRAPENDLQIISPYISRRHAEIWPHERGILYEDLSSTSGSYVDGARVEKCVVGAHESVRLGSPDGLVLTVFALDDSSGVDQVRRAGRTEILRVTDFDESPYLTSTDRGMPTRRRSTIEHRVEERLIALINLTSDLLLVDNIDTMADDLLSRVMAILPATRGMVLVEGKPEYRWFGLVSCGVLVFGIVSVSFKTF